MRPVVKFDLYRCPHAAAQKSLTHHTKTTNQHVGVLLSNILIAGTRIVSQGRIDWETVPPGAKVESPACRNTNVDEQLLFVKKKLNTEQEDFIKATEDLRQTIYEKELYLKAELVKKAPDTAVALSLQKNISETRGQFEQQMIEHIIRMKKINQQANQRYPGQRIGF